MSVEVPSSEPEIQTSAVTTHQLQKSGASSPMGQSWPEGVGLWRLYCIPVPALAFQSQQEHRWLQAVSERSRIRGDSLAHAALTAHLQLKWKCRGWLSLAQCCPCTGGAGAGVWAALLQNLLKEKSWGAAGGFPVPGKTQPQEGGSWDHSQHMKPGHGCPRSYALATKSARGQGLPRKGGGKEERMLWNKAPG